MKLFLHRFATSAEATIGALYIDGRFCLFTLEDQPQPNGKVLAETRIPAGVYLIRLKTDGRMHAKYAAKYSDHRGMLELLNVPDFTGVLIHIGNTDRDTAGCILVGDGAVASGELTLSVQGYRRLYGQVANAILAGEGAEISIEDYA
ncbi:MAG: DUF5675 family protein [Gammaproteobacteria bacterium]